jgi:quinoprotein glucose dehydrogenase
MKRILLLALFSALSVNAFADHHLQLVHKDGFDKGAKAWLPTDAKKWTVDKQKNGNSVLHLHGKSDYQPPHRSPHSITLLKDKVVGDFTLTARVQTLQTTRGHRDMCIFFGFQDPAHFYYVHLGETPDPHSSQVFIVNDAPRTKITETPDKGVPWKNGTWHKVKVVRKVKDGLIEIYFDDMSKPQKVAHDKTFQWGAIGLGSFDDLGLWDDVEIHGEIVDKKADQSFPKAKAKKKGKGKKKGSSASVKTPSAKVDSRKKKNAGFKPAGLAESLEFTKWSGDVNVPDPVAISLDNQGRAFVTQTQRRKANDLDIRANRDWIVNDLSFQSVAEKKAFFRERMAPDLWSAGMPVRVEDYNQDDSRDWRDLTFLTERIHLIEDKDGDGKADHIQVYAEDFNTEVTGIAAGVLWHEGDVYSTIAPDVWRLRDTTGDGKADKREVMAHGFGLHIAYGGHDMHGLIVGPDGKIYWSIGDKGISVTDKTGTKHHYPNQGGMMRCNSDGTDFEVFAHGLRNVQEPAFDEFGNWFGVDNDSDQSGEKERFMFIVQGMDAGWRCNYQYRAGGYNPWTAEKIWVPHHEGQPAYIIPPISNYIDGPAGFTYNPGTALNIAYRNHFFLTGAPNGNQYAFRVEPNGASFKMVGEHQIGKGVPIVGWKFGPDGGLYGVDWGGGYPLNRKGAVWKIDDPSYADSTERKEVAKFLKEGFGQRPGSELTRLLSHIDQRVRLGAQFELARRNDLNPIIAGYESRSAMARIHAIWGLGQLARTGRSDATELLVGLLAEKDAELQTQAAKMLGDLKVGMFNSEALVPLLSSKSLRVQMHAAIALRKHSHASAVAPLIKIADSLKPDQTYMRHAVAYGLAGCADSKQIGALARHKNPNVRLIAVVALRNGTDRSYAPNLFLFDEDEAVATEAARTLHDEFSHDRDLGALAAILTHPHNRHGNEAFIRRSINANFRLGGHDYAMRVAEYAARTSAPKALRMEALNALADWKEPHPLDRVTGRFREFVSEARVLKVNELSRHITSLLRDGDADVQARAVDVTTSLGIPVDPEALLAIVSDEEAARPVRVASLNALSSTKAKQLKQAVDTAVMDKTPDLRIRGLQLLAGMDAKAAVERVFWSFEKVTNAPERQNAAVLMGDLGSAPVDEFLIAALKDDAKLGGFPLAQLELLQSAEKRAVKNDLVKQALDALNARREKALKSNPLAQFEECVDGGDSKAGKEIFNTHIFAQCARCHTTKKGKGSDIGPNLQFIGEKDKRELLHSMIDPNAAIAEGYGNVSVVLKDDSLVAGLMRKETDKELTVRTPDGKDVKIPVETIKHRTPAVSLMPPIGQMLKKHEIRDLVAYLGTLKDKRK